VIVVRAVTRQAPSNFEVAWTLPSARLPSLEKQTPNLGSLAGRPIPEATSARLGGLSAQMRPESAGTEVARGRDVVAGARSPAPGRRRRGRRRSTRPSRVLKNQVVETLWMCSSFSPDLPLVIAA